MVFEIHDSRIFKDERFSFNSHFYFKHIRVACSKLVQNHDIKELNKAPASRNVKGGGGGGGFKNPTITFTS